MEELYPRPGPPTKRLHERSCYQKDTEKIGGDAIISFPRKRLTMTDWEVKLSRCSLPQLTSLFNPLQLQEVLNFKRTFRSSFIHPHTPFRSLLLINPYRPWWGKTFLFMTHSFVGSLPIPNKQYVMAGGPRRSNNSKISLGLEEAVSNPAILIDDRAQIHHPLPRLSQLQLDWYRCPDPLYFLSPLNPPPPPPISASMHALSARALSIGTTSYKLRYAL